jgi:transposase-like protein
VISVNHYYTIVRNLLEYLNKEVKHHADVVGIFPNEATITHLIGAVLLEALNAIAPLIKRPAIRVAAASADANPQ